MYTPKKAYFYGTGRRKSSVARDLRRTAPDALHTSTASLVWSFIVVTSFFKSYKISIAHFAALHKGKRRESCADVRFSSEDFSAQTFRCARTV